MCMYNTYVSATCIVSFSHFACLHFKYGQRSFSDYGLTRTWIIAQLKNSHVKRFSHDDFAIDSSFDLFWNCIVNETLLLRVNLNDKLLYSDEMYYDCYTALMRQPKIGSKIFKISNSVVFILTSANKLKSIHSHVIHLKCNPFRVLRPHNIFDCNYKKWKLILRLDIKCFSIRLYELLVIHLECKQKFIIFFLINSKINL